MQLEQCIDLAARGEVKVRNGLLGLGQAAGQRFGRYAATGLANHRRLVYQILGKKLPDDIWQDYLQGTGQTKLGPLAVLPPGARPEQVLGVIGLTSWTAWFGVHDIITD